MQEWVDNLINDHKAYKIKYLFTIYTIYSTYRRIEGHHHNGFISERPNWGGNFNEGVNLKDNHLGKKWNGNLVSDWIEKHPICEGPK